MSHKHISITVISFLLCSIPVFRADAQGNTNDVGKTSEQSFFKESSSSSREPGAHGDFRGNFFSEDQFTNFLGMHFSRVKISDEKVIFVAQNEMTKAKYIKLYKATGKKLDKLKRKLKAEKEEEKSRVEMICEIKDRILEQFEKDNPEKVIELTQLWLKYKENKQEEKEKVTKKVSYKLGSALSGIVSGFKEGVNND